MEKLTKKDYSLIICFFIVSIIFLWVISPLGKLFLPVNSSNLENQLGLKLDSSSQLLSIKDDIYNILISNPHPHILSIIFLSKPNSKEDIIVTKTTNDKIKRFWQNTGYSIKTINNCLDKSFDKNSAFICHFEAEKNELNSKTLKEGSLAMLSREKDSIFIASIASLNAYNPNIIINLLERISKK